MGRMRVESRELRALNPSDTSDIHRRRFTREFMLEAIRLLEQRQQGNSTPTPVSTIAYFCHNALGPRMGG